MAAFEYLSVLISIILALGMTRVLAGVGEMLQARSRRRIYWVHLLWVINLFLYLVIAWWIFYRWRNQQPWTFYLFVFVLISPTVLYLASLLLFPRESDLDSAIVDSLLKGVPHFLELGPIYFASGILYSTGFVVAAITRNERFHKFYAIFFFCQTVAISFLIFQTLA